MSLQKQKPKQKFQICMYTHYSNLANPVNPAEILAGAGATLPYW